jgi:hypothetical protein
VKRWLAVVAGGFGLAAYVQRRRRRRAKQEEVEPADELRAKLAESRDQESRATIEPEADVAPEPEPDDAPAPDELGDHRRDVHERGRQALDELS